MFSSEFCEIFKNISFTKHLRATASELPNKVEVKISFNCLMQSNNKYKIDFYIFITN